MQHIILVVDDNQDAADSLAELLRHAGHQVNVAYNGMCALARVRTLRRRPALTLVPALSVDRPPDRPHLELS